MSKLYWLDLETTGLDPHNDDILEIAISVSDLQKPFDITDVFHVILPFYPGFVPNLSTNVIDMHSKSGLWEECFESDETWESINDDLLRLVPEVENYSDRPILAGSSVHFDHEFLKDKFPKVAKRFHHRHYDVSAIKLFCESLGMPKLPRAEAHRARADINESVAHVKCCADWITGAGY